MPDTLCGSSTLTSMTVSVVALVVFATASSAAASDITRHVRTRDGRLDALIADGARRSPLFRSLLEVLERSSVIVYVESRLLPARLSGRLILAGVGLSGVGPPWRYLRIDIECRQSLNDQIAALGHELQHAVEIADAAAIVDHRSIQVLYGRIGFAVDASRRQFESLAARNAGAQVHRDLMSRDAAASRR